MPAPGIGPVNDDENQSLGVFPLAEIKELLELSFVSQICSDHIQQRADATIADIESQIRSLQQMKRSLGKIVKRCRNKNSTDNCPLVHKTKK